MLLVLISLVVFSLFPCNHVYCSLRTWWASGLVLSLLFLLLANGVGLVIETSSRLNSRWYLAVRGIEANGVGLVMWVVHVALPHLRVPALYPFCSPYSDDWRVVRLVLRQSVVDQPLFCLLLCHCGSVRCRSAHVGRRCRVLLGWHYCYCQSWMTCGCRLYHL